MQRINFFEADVKYRLPNKNNLREKIAQLVDSEGFKLICLNIVICSDNYLLDMNKAYLEHDYYTDILTFDQSDKKLDVEGDLYISIDRVKENATINNCALWVELQRVVIHGTLHLVGYNDHNDKEKEIMREKEDLYLSPS